MLCRDAGELEQYLARIRDRSWFHRYGVLIQELVPPLSYDLRVIIAGKRVVGAERREAAPGEWRINEILGGRNNNNTNTTTTTPPAVRIALASQAPPYSPCRAGPGTPPDARTASPAGP